MIFQSEIRRLMVTVKKAMVLGAAATFLVSGFAYADETDDSEYEHNKLDEITGKPIGGSDTDSSDSDGEEDSIVRVNSTIKYDNSSDLFYISVNGLGTDLISCSVTTGAVTQQPVSISISKDTASKVYCDGNEIEMDDGTATFSNSGDYVVKVYGSSGKTYIPLKFSILASDSNTETIETSGLYRIESAIYNDNSIAVSKNTISTTEEGIYSIYVLNTAIKKTEKIEVNILHTVPTLKLAEVDEKGLARSAVDISDAKPDWDLAVYYEGELVTVEDGLLVSPGVYSIIVADAAGNKNNYSFTILLYIDNIGMIFISIVVGITFILLIVIIISRKKMKVR